MEVANARIFEKKFLQSRFVSWGDVDVQLSLMFWGEGPEWERKAPIKQSPLRKMHQRVI